MRYLMSVAVFACVSLAPAAEVEFLHGPLADAIARAEKEKKPVMIDFLTDWCRWCDTLDARTYSDNTVASYINERTVPIKVDAEKGEGIDIAKRYSVHGYPTILLITAGGEEIDRLVGYQPPEPFLKELTGYVNGKGTLSALTKELKARPDDVDLLFAVAGKYDNRSDVATSTEYYQRVVELDPADAHGHNRQARYAIAGAAIRRSKDAGPLTDFVQRYPDAEETRSALMTLTMTSLRGKDGARAHTYFAQYLSKWPDDASALNNYAWTCSEQSTNLEEASAVAQKAVALARTGDEKAMYLDTYATVQCTLGRVEEAIHLEQQALDLLKDAPAKERKSYEDTMAKFRASQKMVPGY